jgi:hypothetical protein
MNEKIDDKKQPNEGVKAPDVELSPEVVTKLAQYFDEVFSQLATLRDTTDKAHSGFMAYMDRVILLSGGTLTLTFSAIATISSHLNELGKSAVHPQYVVAECWLLVTAIIFGLQYSRTMIILRQKNDQQITLQFMALKAKLKLMAINPRADFSKIPDWKDEDSGKEVNRLTRIVRIYSAIIHLSLAAAFVCLSIFIQGNIVSILTAASAGIKK